MKLPIIKLLKKREYQEIATFQDTVIDILYNVESNVVLHGGTAIWRCFSGNRFSNDIDIYLGTNVSLLSIKAKIESAASEYGARLEKIKDTGHLVFMAFSLGDTYLKVEINHVKKGMKPIATRFEKVDGTYTDVLTLPPDKLMEEKIAAYSDRRFIRDIYDMYVLSDYIENKNALRKEVLSFLSKIEEPVNESDLKAIIYQGPVPSFKNMVNHIRGRFA